MVDTGSILACDLCCRPLSVRDDRVTVKSQGRVVIRARICEHCFDAIDQVRQNGLDRVRERR